MFSVLALLIALFVGLLVTRVATAVLVATGMSRQYAKFQARSAFTGVGFTTSEAEDVVNHPVRRRVVMMLMLLGNLGIATLVVTLFQTFTNASSSTEGFVRLTAVVCGLMVIWWLSSSQAFDNLIRRMMQRFIHGESGVALRDYAGLLQVAHDYDIGELSVRDGDWLAGKTLARLKLNDEGVIILGVERDGGYDGTPRGDYEIQPGDLLVLYGRSDVLRDLDNRRAGLSGELTHIDRVAEQRRRDVEATGEMPIIEVDDTDQAAD